jgi:hypothetical protein
MYIRRFLVTPYNLLRQYGLLFLVVHIFRWLRWKYLTLQIRRLYFASQRKQRTSSSVHDETLFTEEIVSYGLQEISQVKIKYANLYSDREDLRFLFNMPPEGGAQHFYFLDLAQCLQHAGMKVHLCTASAENLEKVLSDFRPSVFLTGDKPFFAQTLDTESLTRYKKQYGLARFFIPHYLSLLKPGRALSSKEEADRISLHRDGKLADAFFAYFEDVFWDLFCEPWKDTGLNYFSIPFAANPLRHYPMRATKDFDWAIATANSDVGGRAELTYKYMRRIIGKYNGAIAGNYWGKGIYPIPPNEIAQFFSRVRVSPNIAAESNVRYPLDCGAKVHELSAMGVFQLTTETEALRKYYSPTEIVGFRSPEEFNALFDYFVDKPQVRQMYIRNGMARTFAENTYFQRIDKLIGVLDQHPELF